MSIPSGPQAWSRADAEVRAAFLATVAADGLPGDGLRLSWSNWMFGREDLADSAARLARHGIRWIELHGNHYGADLGYRPAEVRRILAGHGIRVAGVCGMFSAENDLSAVSGLVRQAAFDYLRRSLDFAAAVGGSYLLTVPGAVGRPRPYDDGEFERCVDSLRRAAPLFAEHGIRCAIEPIRADEVSFCHTVADAQALLAAVDHPWVRWVNGDVYHMLHGEAHIGQAVCTAGAQLANLHLADTNRGALGDGMLDVDTLIMALYAIGYPGSGGFVTAEPLGAGADPYRRMHGRSDPAALDRLVGQTAQAWREREATVRALAATARPPCALVASG